MYRGELRSGAGDLSSHSAASRWHCCPQVACGGSRVMWDMVKNPLHGLAVRGGESCRRGPGLACHSESPAKRRARSRGVLLCRPAHAHLLPRAAGPLVLRCSHGLPATARLPHPPPDFCAPHGGSAELESVVGSQVLTHSAGWTT